MRHYGNIPRVSQRRCSHQGRSLSISCLAMSESSAALPELCFSVANMSTVHSHTSVCCRSYGVLHLCGRHSGSSLRGWVMQAWERLAFSLNVDSLVIFGLFFHLDI